MEAIELEPYSVGEKKTRVGHTVRSSEERERLLRLYDESGLSARIFTRKQGTRTSKPTQMLMLQNTLRVFLAVEPVDMRKQHTGLYCLAKEKLREDPLGGALFVFTNKSRNRLKVLYWDGTGLWVFAKRLEEGRFSWPQGVGSDYKLSLEPEALQLLLSGIDMKAGCRKPWYQR